MRGRSAGGTWTGASLNPARLLAGLIVFGCNVSPETNASYNVLSQLLQLELFLWA